MGIGPVTSGGWRPSSAAERAASKARARGQIGGALKRGGKVVGKGALGLGGLIGAGLIIDQLVGQ